MAGRAERFATLIKLRLPFALPHILTGLRIAAGLAVIGAIVGEFITGAGIGGAILVSRQQNRVDKVFDQRCMQIGLRRMRLDTFTLITQDSHVSFVQNGHMD